MINYSLILFDIKEKHVKRSGHSHSFQTPANLVRFLEIRILQKFTELLGPPP